MVKFLFSKASEQIWVIQKVQKYHQITFYKKISFNPIGRQSRRKLYYGDEGWGGRGQGVVGASENVDDHGWPTIKNKKNTN